MTDTLTEIKNGGEVHVHIPRLMNRLLATVANLHAYTPMKESYVRFLETKVHNIGLYQCAHTVASVLCTQHRKSVHRWDVLGSFATFSVPFDPADLAVRM